MPRVHYVKKARKDNPAVKAGQEYWWWRTRRTAGKTYISRKHYSAKPPRQSQLTQSEYYQTCYRNMETITEDLGEIIDESSCEDAASVLEDVKSELELFKEEVEEKKEAVGEAFNCSGDTYDTLEQRIEALENLIQSLESAHDELTGIDWPVESDSPADDDDDAEREEYEKYESELEYARAEAQGAIDGIDWTFE